MAVRRLLLLGALRTSLLALAQDDAVALIQQVPEVPQVPLSAEPPSAPVQEAAVAVVPPAPPAPPAAPLAAEVAPEVEAASEVRAAPVVPAAPAVPVTQAAASAALATPVAPAKNAAAPDFQVGESVTMRVEGGLHAGALAPAVVKSKKPNNRYHLRLLTSVSRDLFNIDPTVLNRADKPGFASTVESFQTFGGAEAVAEQLEKESLARTHTEAVDRKLNTTELQHWVASLRSIMEKEMQKEAAMVGCPSGFAMVNGDARRIDRVGSQILMTNTASACGQSCQAQDGCNAFQWSPVKKSCFMSSAAAPTYKHNFKDFIFCGKKA